MHAIWQISSCVALDTRLAHRIVASDTRIQPDTDRGQRVRRTTGQGDKDMPHSGLVLRRSVKRNCFPLVTGAEPFDTKSDDLLISICVIPFRVPRTPNQVLD